MSLLLELKKKWGNEYHKFLSNDVMQDMNGETVIKDTTLICSRCKVENFFHIDFYDDFKKVFLCVPCYIESSIPQTINHAFNHPDHYQSKSGLEVIDVIESFGLDFCRGNAIKYILRCGKKDDCELEIRKAIWYLERFLQDMNATEKK